MSEVETSDQRGQRGATAVEYALMVAFIALAVVTTVSLLGVKLATFFGSACTQMFGSC